MSKPDVSRKVKSYLEQASSAHTDLNVFASIVTILEGGHIYNSDARTDGAVNKIIAICQREQQNLLRQHDEAEAKIVALIAAEDRHG